MAAATTAAVPRRRAQDNAAETSSLPSAAPLTSASPSGPFVPGVQEQPRNPPLVAGRDGSGRRTGNSRLLFRCANGEAPHRGGNERHGRG